ncbi:MAG: urea carboxylase [Thiobacillaceae bacterium]
MPPGSGLLASVEEAVAAAHRVGFPVMVKAVAGGGGIGMQAVEEPDELPEVFARVKRLAAQYFKNDGVYLERLIRRARHIEVQIFGDGERVVALGDRDCSVQRRNQKVLEETPAPGLSDEQRHALHAAAEQLGTAVGYRSAGTVEFVYDVERGEFYFLEVNTRLQVEHCITEEVTGLDLVEWMVRVGAGEKLPAAWPPPSSGVAIEARLYAEDPARDFQPCAGRLTEVSYPEGVRVDGWVAAGTEVTSYYDPLLAKLIVKGSDRADAVTRLAAALKATRIAGIQTNLGYLAAIAATPAYRAGAVTTQWLNSLAFTPDAVEVIEPGTFTTVQDWPGRLGLWHVGVPPSGPMDHFALRAANRCVGNPEGAAALECTVIGPTLKFHRDACIALAGADMAATLDGVAVPLWQGVAVKAGQVLKLGSVQGAGARTYLAVQGGFDVPAYLGSRATFVLGGFGGHAGRTLRAGDWLPVTNAYDTSKLAALPDVARPTYVNAWTIGALYGPHGAPDFFTQDAIDEFFAAPWEVHYNSNRLGVRLKGPQPSWARKDGGEAGLHPSNVHDCEYAIGSVNFTGDFPVILTQDGPSLGGFVCPATIPKSELWKVGQLRPGDYIRFVPMSFDEALAAEQAQDALFADLAPRPLPVVHLGRKLAENASAILHREQVAGLDVVYRQAGDKYLLIEYGDNVLDLMYRLRVHALMESLKAEPVPGIVELSPGVRSLQINFDSRVAHVDRIVAALAAREATLPDAQHLTVDTRVLRLPMAFEDSATLDAVARYRQSVRDTAPWLPSNTEFIRRINGLPSVEAVRDTLYQARYLTLGLGDVYLGAPCAVPVDPRHRLLTSKYSPARTFTPEGTIGIGGVYMCIYGMNSPGGYQLVGRTVPIWNSYLKNPVFGNEPWLLKFFDQVQFYPMSEFELSEYRADFAAGRVGVEITHEIFSLKDHLAFLEREAASIAAFKAAQKAAFDEERERWKDFAFAYATFEAPPEEDIPEGCTPVRAHVAGNIWKLLVAPGDRVRVGDTLLIIESMKMELTVVATEAGVVKKLLCREGTPVSAGQNLLALEVA